MQMDADLKKEQFGNHFVWVGQRKGGIGGGWGIQPKNWARMSKIYFPGAHH
jgi:hypothetical protein